MLSYEGAYSTSPTPQLDHLMIPTHDHHHHHVNHDGFSFLQLHHHRPIFPAPFSTPYTFPHDNPFPSPPRSPSSAFSLYKLPLHQPVQPHVEPLSGYPQDPNRVRVADCDLVSRLYSSSRAAEPTSNSPKCQAEGCIADLRAAKSYHRRHMVCEFHSKASAVITAGSTQRFCQQCSRFHVLPEFDDGKRSCRKRLAVHSLRRKKSHRPTLSEDHTSS